MASIRRNAAAPLRSGAILSNRLVVGYRIFVSTLPLRKDETEFTPFKATGTIRREVARGYPECVSSTTEIGVRMALGAATSTGGAVEPGALFV
jgi:hypothetical protein